MSCPDPCNPCGPEPKHQCAQTLAPVEYRVVARSGGIDETEGSDVTVEFASTGRVLAVRGAPTALGDFTSLESALMGIRVGWSKDAKDPAVRQEDGLASGDASLLSLFGRNADGRLLLRDCDGSEGLCIGKSTKLFVTFSAADGGGTAEAELVFEFQPA